MFTAAPSRAPAGRAADTGPELPRGRAARAPAALGAAGVADRRRTGGQYAENRRHAAQTGIPTETRAGRRDMPFAASAVPQSSTTTTTTTAAKRLGEGSDRPPPIVAPPIGRLVFAPPTCSRSVFAPPTPGRASTATTKTTSAATATATTAAAAASGRRGRVVGKHGENNHQSSGKTTTTVAPGHDAKADPQADVHGRVECRCKSLETAVDAQRLRLDARLARRHRRFRAHIAATESAAAAAAAVIAAVQPRQSVQRDDS